MVFEDRERMEEAKFIHEQELAFRIRNRRNKLFGFWAAETYLGKEGGAAADYAKEVVMADFGDTAGGFDAMSRVREDLKEAGLEISDHILSKRLVEFEQEARRQVMSE
ncbi:MAG: DUF1476 domain-containing protein [Geminicoccaceae bacterium]|nr:DUF1476 domain-containing protein [Geminicoccaceae bacterium]